MQTIPRKIYQSWKTKNLPPELQNIVNKTKSLNPNYEYHLYDDEDCRKFLLDNFGINYVNAFDVLKSGAFKCDLWRYAMLYVNGGIYMDLDMEALVPFDEVIDATSPALVSIVDRTVRGRVGIYQAFLACVPKHPVLLLALELAFSNIATRKSDGDNVLTITGPAVMATALNLYWNKKDPNTTITPGVYTDKNGSIVLYRSVDNNRYTQNLSGKNIFRNKIDDYIALTNYGFVDFYKDQKDYSKMYFLVPIILLLILIIYYRMSWKNCINK